MARPTKLSEALTERICRAIKAGNYPAVAARSCGISEATFYRWMEEGRASETGAQRDFYEAVKRAEADGEVRAVALISKAMSGDWRAAKEFLARRHSQRWGKQESVENSFADERPVLDLTKLSDRELKALEKILARLA